MAMEPTSPPFEERPQFVESRWAGQGVGLVRFLWSLVLFLIIIALLPGRVGLAVGSLVALGAVLFSDKLPEFITTIVQGGSR